MKNKLYIAFSACAVAATAFAFCACGGTADNGGVLPPEPQTSTVALDRAQISLDLFDISAVSTVGSYNGIVWTTDNAEVATVDEAGSILARGEGTCAIVATDASGNTGECTVTVADSGARPEFSFVFDNVELGSGVSYDLECSLTYKGAAYADYTVKYGSEEFVVLEVDGPKMTGRRLGDTKVKATADWRGRKLEATANVSVKKVAVGTASLVVDKYGDAPIAATAIDKNGSLPDANIVWTSSDESIAQVVGGRVYGKGAGTATVTARLSEYVYGECSVTVNDSPEPVLELNATEFDFNAADTAKLNATLKHNGQAKSDAEIVFSTDSEIVSVDENGNITMNDYGSAEITVTATWRGVQLTEKVSVRRKSLFIDKTEVTLDKYDLCTLVPTYRGQTGGDITETLAWTSSDESVVKVDCGVITVMGEGSADVTVAAPDKSTVTCVVDVTYSGAEPILELSDTDLKFNMNGEKTLSAVVKYKGEAVGDAVISFAAQNGSGKATVDQDGKIKMTGYGDAEINVSASWRGASLSGTVSLLCSSLVLNKTTVTLDRYDECTLIPSYRGQTGDEITDPLTWTSGDESVVKVVNGVIEIVGGGTTKVSVSAADGSNAECTVTVAITAAQPVLELSATSLSFDRINAEQSVTAAVKYKGAEVSGYTVTFAADGSAVEVDGNGKITVKSDGTATVTASTTWKGVALSCAVAVDCGGVLAIDADSLELDRYEEGKVSHAYDGRTGSAITETLVWASSNTSVVTVAGGKLSVVGVGSANITVTAPGGTVKTCAVTVVDSGALPQLVLDNAISDILKKGDGRTVTGYVMYKNVAYDSIELTCASDGTAIATSGATYTGSSYGKATVTASGSWRGASVQTTALVTVYAEYYDPMSDERLVSLYNASGAGGSTGQMTFITEDYRSTGAVYAISKNVYDGLYAVKTDNIQTAEQSGIVKQTDAVYGWYEIDRSRLGVFLDTWYDVARQWDSSTFHVQPMIKEIDGCYFLWWGNMLLFGDPHDGGWNNGSCTGFYWTNPDGSLPNENIIHPSFTVEIDGFIKIQNPIADTAGTGRVYEITENIYGTFKYTDETLTENGLTYTKIDDQSIGLYTDRYKAPYYDQDIYNNANVYGDKFYDSFANYSDVGAYAAYDNATGKYYLWIKAFESIVYKPNDVNYYENTGEYHLGNDWAMQDRRSMLVWTSVDGKRCEHTVRTNVG